MHDTVRDLTVRCFSSRTTHWRHTHNGKKSLTRRVRGYSGDDSSSSTEHVNAPRTPVEEIKILTWNVDAMAENCRTRLATVLEHIQVDIFDCPYNESPLPCCILLQELHPQAISELLENEWIRKHFCVAPSKSSDWPEDQYGNVTLVSRTIPVLSAQVLPFRNSAMGRHAVIVDLLLDAPPASSSDEDSDYGSSTVTVRVANVHLESLTYGTSCRPEQLLVTAKKLREDGIHVGVVAGDMNCITPQDRLIHEQASLLDAWTRDDDDEAGLTWGFQPPSQFPPNRLDKILYTSDERCTVDEPQQVGAGLETVQGQWASDHYGLLTTLRVI